MWFKRTPMPPPPAPTTVACSACGHIVLESRATFVKVPGGKRWYCAEHQKPYDECVDYGVDTYYRRMRVDAQGVPIGYLKAPSTAPDTI